MLKIFLWVVSNDGRFFNGALKILERQHNGIELVGLTANAPINIAANGKNIPFVPLDKLGALGGGYDVLLVVGAKQIGMSKITQAARQINLPEEKILGDWIVCIPGFALNKYRRLQRSQLSIFSRNCFGGLISNSLGLPFRSPIVNLFLSVEDFIKFAHIPRIYLEEKLVFQETKFYTGGNHDYPVFKLGNITVNMLHYYTADDARKKWNERKQRINWYNLLATTCAEDEKTLQEFDALPYGKKICFVPFKSDLDSAWYINRKYSTQAAFSEVANDFAKAKIFYYDIFDMLLYGKKTPLIDM